MRFAYVQHARRAIRMARHPVLTARFGELHQTAPLTAWGSERGKPVDRWYIERYLQRQAPLPGGLALEVKSDLYASSLGAVQVDVVDIDPANDDATVVGDLCDPATLDKGRYDAAIVTQTLQLVDDPGAAVHNLVSSLRPGGALLMTVPSVSRLVGPQDLWRWTPNGFFRLLAETVPPEARFSVEGLGNGLAARAFLYGLAAEDLPLDALTAEDPNYPLLVGASIRVGDS